MANREKFDHFRYSDIAELKSLVDCDWSQPHNKRVAAGYRTGTTGEKSWHGMRGGNEACIAALVKGYAEGEQRIDAMHDLIMAKLPKAIGVGRKIVRGDQGDELDIHAVNRGDLSTAWTSRKRKIKAGKTALRLVVDIGGNCGVNAERMTWRGVAAIALSEIMQKAGYSVEIVAAFAVRGHCGNDYGRQALVSTVVKQRGAGADRGLLAASVCLSGFFRTLGFGAIAKAADEAGSDVNTNLGHSIQVEGIIPPDPLVTQLVIPSTVGTESEAREWATATIKLLQASGRAR